MDWTVVEANWAYYKNVAKARWTRITAEELDAIGGRREQLAKRIHEIYGISKGAAQMQLESWQGRLKPPPGCASVHTAEAAARTITG